MEMTDSLGDMKTRHRVEQKALQAKITRKKKESSKKTRKAILIECEELEIQLRTRQERECESLIPNTAKVDSSANQTDALKPTICAPRDDITQDGSAVLDVITKSLETTNLSSGPTVIDEAPPRKRNRQKERLARRTAEKESAIESARLEAANQPDKKAVERKNILDQCTAEGLVEEVIRPDGHCLFSAVADQLMQIGISLCTENDDQKEGQMFRVVRKAAANYIEENSNDFVAWLEEPLAQYVEKIRNTAEWGGHLELLALARFYNVIICVVQDGARQTIEPLQNQNRQPPKLWLAYYRHGYGLGEHYNSLRNTS